MIHLISNNCYNKSEQALCGIGVGGPNFNGLMQYKFVSGSQTVKCKVTGM